MHCSPATEGFKHIFQHLFNVSEQICWGVHGGNMVRSAMARQETQAEKNQQEIWCDRKGRWRNKEANETDTVKSIPGGPWPKHGHNGI
jgi:hypothetical protein